MADHDKSPPRAVLKIRDLQVYYGASHALQGVDLTLNSGVHAVVGRNGMGKTTLCNTIMGLTPARAGSIRIDGQEILGRKPHQIARCGVGYTPQGRRLWKSLSVDEHLRMCAKRGSAWSVERIYETFPRLAERRRNGGAQLSGGEQQMLAIGRALLSDPHLLILDEPTEGLAPVIVGQVVDLLHKLADTGDVAILLVEQNIGVATSVADDVAIMVNGRISTVLDAKELGADRGLQQRLLGVGRAEDAAPKTPPPNTTEIAMTSDPTDEDADSVRPIFDEELSGHVLVAGTFDTKGQELGYIADRLRAQDVKLHTVDLSTSGKPSAADIPPHQIAAWHPKGARAVFSDDRGGAVAAMAEAFENWIEAHSDIAGIISAAGSGGTALATPAMQRLKVGVPKVMISTVASGNVEAYVGPADIMMMYSVTDVQGLNRISRKVLGNGADALAGMVQSGTEDSEETKPAIGLSMFGVTTPAIQQLTEKLEPQFDCLVFHCTGVGGRSMEKLADSGLLAGAIDLTTTEICDMMMGGVFAATEDRLGAFIRSGIPYVGSVGALDMVNFGSPASVPETYAGRVFVEHNPQVTLMRTTPEENAAMGRWLGGRLNQMEGPVRFLLPLGGVSAIDAPGQPFHDPVADAALFQALRDTIQQTENRRLIECPAHINDPAFCQAVEQAFSDVMPNYERVFYAEH